jgi:hypothetical protein
MLLAQFNPLFAAGDEDLQIAILLILLVGLVIGLIIQIFFLMTLSKALSHCSPHSRTMEPGMVWLNLIPCVGTIWIFFTVVRLAESLRREYRDRGLREEGDFGQTLGITYNVMYLVGGIPYIGAVASLAGLVCFIIYWVKIAGYSAQLRDAPPDRYGGFRRDDYDRDDYRRDDYRRDDDRRDDYRRDDYDRDRPRDDRISGPDDRY